MEGRIGRGSQEPNHQPSVLPEVDNKTARLQRKRDVRPGRDGGGYPHLTGFPRLRASELSEPVPANAERRRGEEWAEYMRSLVWPHSD